MLFTLNLLNRYDNQKTTKKIDNTHTQLQETMARFSAMLDNINQKIQTINQRMENMDGKIKTTQEAIILTEIVAGNAVQVKLKDLKQSGAEVKK